MQCVRIHKKSPVGIFKQQKDRDIAINFKEVMYMSANVETMFYTREKPWHGLGTRVEEALDSREALRLAGLDWRVVRKFNLWRDRW